jgi:hypothetical protein
MFRFKSELNIYLRIPETPTALLRRRRVAMGAILGRFFKVLVLVPACALVLAVVLVRSADGEYGLLRPLLEFAVLITSLQIGYVFGLVHIGFRACRNAGEPWPCPQPTPRANSCLMRADHGEYRVTDTGSRFRPRLERGSFWPPALCRSPVFLGSCSCRGTPLKEISHIAYGPDVSPPPRCPRKDRRRVHR